MEKWKLYAFASALFAGFTSVLAKAGLKNLSADVSLVVRTAFVLGFVMLNLWMWTGVQAGVSALSAAGGRVVMLLALSALTTALSWICYFRAMKDGTVSFVTLVDKGSILVTVVLSVLVLGEPTSWRLAAGTALIVAGLLVIART